MSLLSQILVTIPDALYITVEDGLLQCGEQGKDWCICPRFCNPNEYYIRTNMTETAKEVLRKHEVDYRLI